MATTSAIYYRLEGLPLALPLAVPTNTWLGFMYSNVAWLAGLTVRERVVDGIAWRTAACAACAAAVTATITSGTIGGTCDHHTVGAMLTAPLWTRDDAQTLQLYARFNVEYEAFEWRGQALAVLVGASRERALALLEAGREAPAIRISGATLQLQEAYAGALPALDGFLASLIGLEYEATRLPPFEGGALVTPQLADELQAAFQVARLPACILPGARGAAPAA